MNVAKRPIMKHPANIKQRDDPEKRSIRRDDLKDKTCAEGD